MRLRLMPREKQYFASQAEFVSTVYANGNHASATAQHFYARPVLGMHILSLEERAQRGEAHTLPPKTSSPMIRHAAVLIVLLLCVLVAMLIDDVVVTVGTRADVTASRGRERCLLT